MSFASLNYYIFLLAVAVVFYVLPGRFRSALLLSASYFFYLSFEPRYIFFILTTTAVSYCSALMMAKGREKWRAPALAFALSVELCLLGVTKYWNPVAAATHWLPTLEILVPLGISFYTFQTIGYLFDVYRRRLPAETNLLRYSLFLSFFPHLLAGPIEPAQHFLPQLQNPKNFEKKFIKAGLFLVVFGLFKKIVIADHLAPVVALIFDSPTEHFGIAVFFALFLARYQIYCDFSGYTDIALGSAQLFGIELSPNFNRPFFSSSITEYWRRWHMSLGNWIRQYIFYPLVSTPVARVGVHGLVLLTFLILGIWHGGTLNFLIYGLWHGGFVVADGMTRQFRHKVYESAGLTRFPRLLDALAVLLTFFLIVVPPTLFFRSTSFDNSLILIHNLFVSGWNMESIRFLWENLSLRWDLQVALIAILGMELFMAWKEKAAFNLLSISRWKFASILITIILLILVFGRFNSDAKFIYMRF